MYRGFWEVSHLAYVLGLWMFQWMYKSHHYICMQGLPGFWLWHLQISSFFYSRTHVLQVASSSGILNWNFIFQYLITVWFKPQMQRRTKFFETLSLGSMHSLPPPPNVNRNHTPPIGRPLTSFRTREVEKPMALAKPCEVKTTTCSAELSFFVTIGIAQNPLSGYLAQW